MWNISKFHRHIVLNSICMPIVHIKSTLKMLTLWGFWISIDWDFGVLPMFEDHNDVYLHQEMIHK
jgi:hypothetical protein